MIIHNLKNVNILHQNNAFIESEVNMEQGFEKRFKTGDIVYWCHQRGYEYSVHWGIVDEQFSDAVCVDYLAVKERRLINGIPIDEFNDTKYKKLPKGWSYNTQLYEITYDDIDSCIIDIKKPETIKSAYEKGLLVKNSAIFHGVVEADITKDGYRIIKKYPPWVSHISHTSVRPDKVYFTYEEAKEEVDVNIAEFHRQASLSGYDWSVEQINKTLNMWQRINNETDKLKNRYREWLLVMDKVEDIETRLYGGEVQWKYWKRQKWNNIEL